ncbi:hypothetical protein FRACA_270021 [Frankia canadensis]|uniref:Uncharacterized protein n=1 Tax=Frankia canadensis TaxID=1836972 RepID=A0A2I2KSQ7_9ACTN|nr:hypothetical protein FRACA_270021 [Frankia canadensis]SOU55994.1 hypothetical protein FRACA_270021 [Frankia canadensis]
MSSRVGSYGGCIRRPHQEPAVTAVPTVPPGRPPRHPAGTRRTVRDPIVAARRNGGRSNVCLIS